MQRTFVEVDLRRRPTPALLPNLLRLLDLLETFLFPRRHLLDLRFRLLEPAPELGNLSLLRLDVTLNTN